MDNIDIYALIAQVQFELLANGSDLLASYIRGAKFSGGGTALHDIRGDLIAIRYPLAREEERLGYVDVAVHPVLGGPLHAISRDRDWDPGELLGKARQTVEKLMPGIDSGRARFEMYSYPRLGIRFFSNASEILLDTFDGAVILPRPSLTPGGWGSYESWSLLGRADEVGEGVTHDYEKWVSFGNNLVTQFPQISSENWLGGLSFSDIIEAFPELNADEGKTVEMCLNLGDENCFQGHAQKTGHWCVPASVEMILSFFLLAAAEPTQEEIADKLGQGTLSQSFELPRKNEGEIIQVVEKFAKQARNELRGQISSIPIDMVQMIMREISAGRPLILLGVEHAWVVTGFRLMSGPGASKQLGLALYNPLPVGTGTPSAWDLFNSTCYTTVISTESGGARILPFLSVFKRVSTWIAEFFSHS